MKKILAIVMVGVMCLALAGCSGGNTPSTSTPTPDAQQSENNSPAEEELTQEEKWAALYLATFAKDFKNPHSIELYNVWYYTRGENPKHFFAFNLSAENSVGGRQEKTYGNSEGLSSVYFKNASTVEQMIKEAYVNSTVSDKWWTTSNLEAKENGTKLNAERVQKAFEDLL